MRPRLRRHRSLSPPCPAHAAPRDGRGGPLRCAAAARRVINDFEAVGYGVLELPESQLLTLNNVPAT